MNQPNGGMRERFFNEFVQSENTNWIMTDVPAPAIEKFIQSEIDLALAKQRSELMEGLTNLFDRLESNDPDTSMENWKNYKFIRNNIRDFISTITKDTKVY